MTAKPAKQNITLNIYDTRIPMVVDREDEELYREVAQLINNRLNLYFDHYKGLKSDKEIMYYTMIDIACLLSKQNRETHFKRIQDLLGGLSTEIEEALKEE